MSFFEELKRRNVFRVGAAYAVAGWLLMQIVDVFAPALRLPDWFPTAVAFLLLLGFPVALFFAWAFEITPEGIKRESEVEHDASVTHETAARLDRVTIALLVLVAGFVLIDRFVLNVDHQAEPQIATIEADTQAPAAAVGTTPAPSEDGKISVAVLPFVNMSDDAQNEYFSDGISEELLNVLVKVDSLRVPSRTSSFTFKGSEQTIIEIGKALKVDHVLEGSVRKAGNRIRVTAQLIDVNTDTHLWSDTYTRELDDIFAVQDEISQSIVQALQVTLSGTDRESISEYGTDNAEAYNKYLLGRHMWNSRAPQALLDSTVPLLEAVELDPQFDRAWAALADAYVLIPEYQAGPIDENIALANEAIAKALAINGTSARALTSRGYVKSMYEYDIPGALADFEQAIALDPKYPTAHQWYGEILAVDRRLDEALVQIDKAIELDPLAPIIHHVRGWLLQGDGQYEAAKVSYNNALQIDPHKAHTYLNLASLYTKMGEYDLAREADNRGAELWGFDNTPFRLLLDALENPSLKAKAIQAIQDSPVFVDGASANAQLYMMLGEHELALDSLETAFERGDPYAIHMNRLDSSYTPIRDHPRFQALLRKMNLLP
ncbi:MAG: tetratricopeptide repeat protein [Xanthomonadales bacterium]|nr:tetratricopeptide repeat protein [Xanthomonadales bacterium]